MRTFQSAIIGACFIILSAPAYAESQALLNPVFGIHHAPAENLERIDVELIDSAEHEIDLAAYVLTYPPII